MPFVSGNHLFLFLIFLVIVLIIFGPGKLPEVGQGMGRAIREFRKASSEVKDSVTSAVSDERKGEPHREEARPATKEAEPVSSGAEETRASA